MPLFSGPELIVPACLQQARASPAGGDSLLSILVVTFFALVIGYICLRLRGPFFALPRFPWASSSDHCRKPRDFTGGDLGIMIRERTWVEKIWYYYIILAIAFGTFIAVKFVMESKLGYYFVAIREDQDAAESLGINTTLYKNIALC